MKSTTTKVLSLVLTLIMLMSTFAVAIIPASALELCPDCNTANLIEHYHPATCTIAGYIQKSCFTCGYFSRKDIDAKGHGELVVVTTVAPTCNTTGEQAVLCKDCGVVTKTTVLEATGHSKVGVSVIVTEPTIVNYADSC